MKLLRRGWVEPVQSDPLWALLGLGAAVVIVVGLVFGTKGLPAMLATAAAIPLAFALRRRPQRGVLLLVALVPFDGLRLISHLPSSASAWKEVLVFGILAATFVAPAEARAKKERRRLPGWTPAVIGLLVIGVVSAAVVGTNQAVIGFRIDYFYVLLAVAVWRCPLSEKERDKVITTLMVTGVITSLVGIVQQVLGAARLNALGYPYNTVIITAAGHLRSFSTFATNFNFAFFLMAVIIVCLPSALSDVSRRRNQIFLASLPVFAVGLLFTYTRGAWLGLAAGGLYIGIRRHRVILLSVPAVLLAFAFLPGSIRSTSFSSRSLGQRAVGWEQNFEQILEHPLGSGIGATGAAAQEVARLEASGQSVDTAVPGTPVYQPDNWYYQAVYDSGIPGLWLWILLLISAFASAAYVFRHTRGAEAAFALGVAASIIGAAAASFVTTYFESFPADVLFWLEITVIVAGLPASASAWASSRIDGAEHLHQMDPNRTELSPPSAHPPG